MPCKNPCRLHIHLAFTYFIGSSSVVWSELGLAVSFPSMRVLEEAMVTGSQCSGWSGHYTCSMLCNVGSWQRLIFFGILYLILCFILYILLVLFLFLFSFLPSLRWHCQLTSNRPGTWLRQSVQCYACTIIHILYIFSFYKVNHIWYMWHNP